MKRHAGRERKSRDCGQGRKKPEGKERLFTVYKPLLIIFFLFTSPGGSVPPIDVLDKGIQFQNIDFSYPSRPDVSIFKNLTLDVPAGSVTAVVGPSGSGKSTLGSLLLRLYDPDQGQVMVGGHDVKTVSLDWLRGSAGTVHQVRLNEEKN